MDTSEFDMSDVQEMQEEEEGDAEGGPQPTEPVQVLDLDHLDALLGLLTKHNVQGFQTPGLSLSFHELSDEERARARLSKIQVENEDRSTSAKPVAGFDPKVTAGFNNPKLWPATNGKHLTLAGNLE